MPRRAAPDGKLSQTPSSSTWADPSGMGYRSTLWPVLQVILREIVSVNLGLWRRWRSLFCHPERTRRISSPLAHGMRSFAALQRGVYSARDDMSRLAAFSDGLCGAGHDADPRAVSVGLSRTQLCARSSRRKDTSGDHIILAYRRDGASHSRLLPLVSLPTQMPAKCCQKSLDRDQAQAASPGLGESMIWRRQCRPLFGCPLSALGSV